MPAIAAKPALPPLDLSSATAVVMLANMVTEQEVASVEEMAEILVRLAAAVAACACWTIA